MKNLYGYIRVSTAKQGEGVSLDVQKEAIIRYAVQYNFNIVQWFEEKETAAKQGRPLFTAMMKLLKTKKADGVIMHKIDRSARNLKDWADLGNLIDDGVDVHFAHESLDMHARGGRLSADIQAIIAADYIRNLKQEAIKGLYGRLKQGIYPFGAPLGYLNTGKGKAKSIDLIKGPLVRKAFELYATRQYTLETLLEHLHNLGLRNIKDKKLNLNGLSYILNNPYYMGIIKIKRNGSTFNGVHEPIISPNLFKRVQTILRGNDNQKTRKHFFIFRKLLKCKACTKTLIGETQKGHIYYRCHTTGCVTKGMREATLDNLLQKPLEAVQLFPEEVESFTELLAEADDDWETKRTELLKSINLQSGQINERLERLTDCYIDGGLDKETYERRKEKLLVESKEKENKLKEISSEKEGILRKVRQFLERVKSLINIYGIGIPEEKRELLEIATSNLTVEGKKLEITMRSPFYEVAERWNFNLGCTATRPLSKNEGKIIFSDVNTSPVIGKPLTKEQLRPLFEIILKTVGELPDLNDETEYVG